MHCPEQTPPRQPHNLFDTDIVIAEDEITYIATATQNDETLMEVTRLTQGWPETNKTLRHDLPTNMKLQQTTS